jgi:hypothetical protein
MARRAAEQEVRQTPILNRRPDDEPLERFDEAPLTDEARELLEGSTHHVSRWMSAKR